MSFDTVPRRPWYREPWPWALMAGPATVVVAAVITMAIALPSNDGVVADDYYKQGLAINQVMTRDRLARELGLSATASFSGNRVRVVLGAGDDLPSSLRLKLVHPTRSGADEVAALRVLAPRVYEGSLAHANSGRRTLILEDAAASWRLEGRRDAGADSALLVPSR